MDWESIWGTITSFFTDNVWNIVFFFAALVVGMIVIKIIVTVMRKIMTRSKIEEVARNFLLTILKFLLWLVLFLVLLSIIGIKITGIITALSAAILAVGMALQNNIANIASGIIIVVYKMFKKGDKITVGDKEGTVVEINFLFTTVNTPDNRRITIPNSSIVNGSVINAGANPKRRVDFTFPVAYDSDVELVRKIVLDVMTSDGRVYMDPAPFCKLKVFGSSSIDFFANCWCDSEDYWDVYYYVMENVFNEFKRHGISIPFSQVEVRTLTNEVNMPYREDSLPERVEKERKEAEESPIRRAYEEAKKNIEENKEKRANKRKNSDNSDEKDNK